MSRLKQLWAKYEENRVRALILLGICGIALILLSGLFSDYSPNTADSPAVVQTDSTADYVAKIEQKLTNLLAKMDGVGMVNVMVTVSGTAEQVYAEEVNVSQSDKSRQSQNAYVITKSGGNESALVSQTRFPKIEGVAVLCSGGGKMTVQEQVVRAVSTVLGIPASDIFVGRQTAASLS